MTLPDLLELASESLRDPSKGLGCIPVWMGMKEQSYWNQVVNAGILFLNIFWAILAT